EVIGSDEANHLSGEFSSRDDPDDHAHAEQSVNPPGLPRREEIARDHPALGYGDHAEQPYPDREDINYGGIATTEWIPHAEEACHRETEGPCDGRVARRAGHGFAIDESQTPAKHGHQDVEIRKFIDVELVQEHRLGCGPEDVVCEQNEQQVERHEYRSAIFFGSDVEQASPGLCHFSHKSPLSQGVGYRVSLC